MYRYDYGKTPSSGLSDSALVNQIIAGDDQAFEYLVGRYRTPLYSFICRRLGDCELARDVLQFVFLQLYLSMPRLHTILATPRTKSPVRSWLFQVACNKCLDEMRKIRPLLFSELEVIDEGEDHSLLDSIPDPCPPLDEIAEHHDLQGRLCRAIQSLPPKFRRVVFLRYTRELTFVEIGHILNIPENTAKTYFQRARPLLRAALAPDMLAVLAS